jgi:hypothetical protein
MTRQQLANLLFDVPVVMNEIIGERCAHRGAMSIELLCDGTRRLDRKLHAYLVFANLTYGDGTQEHGLIGIRFLDNCSEASRDVYIVAFQECAVLCRLVDGEMRICATSRCGDNCTVEDRARRLSAQLVSGRAGAFLAEFAWDGSLPADVPSNPVFDGVLYEVVLPPWSLLSVRDESFIRDGHPVMPVLVCRADFF